MSFLDLLHKKEEDKKDSSITNSSLDIPNDIPIPPPSEKKELEPIPEPEGLKTNNNNNNNIPATIPTEIPPAPADDFSDIPPLEDNKNMSSEEIPKAEISKNKIKLENNQTESKTTDKENKIKEDEDFEFSLPDFSDEDIKIGELEQEEDKEEKEEEEIKLSKPIKSIESNQETIIIKNNNPKFMNLDNCRKIFFSIRESQTILKKTKEAFTQNETFAKNLTLQYKHSHDDLDAIQEKLMEIDQTLFER